MTFQEELKELLYGTGFTVSAAESCTGGNISHLITTISGSSDYYLGSVTSYAISVKCKVLGVPAETIEKYGVVSEEVAAAMAQGVRDLTGSTWSVATTGLAGKEGDEHFPGGTVCIGVAGPEGVFTKIFHSDSDRIGNIDAFTCSALEFLLFYIRKTLNC